jgi:hypothetical protein
MKGTEFRAYIASLFKARFPYLYISTWEEDRALSAMRQVAEDAAYVRTPRKFFTWSLTTGMVGDGQAGKEETKAPLKALEFIEKFEDPAVFVLKDFHIYFGGQGRLPDFQVMRKIRDLVPVLKRSPRPLR